MKKELLLLTVVSILTGSMAQAQDAARLADEATRKANQKIDEAQDAARAKYNEWTLNANPGETAKEKAIREARLDIRNTRFTLLALQASRYGALTSSVVVAVASVAQFGAARSELAAERGIEKLEAKAVETMMAKSESLPGFVNKAIGLFGGAADKTAKSTLALFKSESHLMIFNAKFIMFPTAIMGATWYLVSPAVIDRMVDHLASQEAVLASLERDAANGI